MCVCVWGGGVTVLQSWQSGIPINTKLGSWGGGGRMSEAQHRGGNSSSSSTGEKMTAGGGAFGPVLIKVQYH